MFFFTVAKRFEAEYGVMRLSIGEAVRRVLMEQPKTELANTINNHLKKGLTVPDDLAVACLEVALMDMTAQTRGYENDSLILFIHCHKMRHFAVRIEENATFTDCH